jgi:hypothetical protein
VPGRRPPMTARLRLPTRLRPCRFRCGSGGRGRPGCASSVGRPGRSHQSGSRPAVAARTARSDSTDSTAVRVTLYIRDGQPVTSPASRRRRLARQQAVGAASHLQPPELLSADCWQPVVRPLALFWPPGRLSRLLRLGFFQAATGPHPRAGRRRVLATALAAIRNRACMAGQGNGTPMRRTSSHARFARHGAGS